METKFVGGKVAEIKTEVRNGVDVGIVIGHIAAWTPDQGGRFGVPDRFQRGAFRNSIADHKARGMRPIRLRDQHGRTVGGFPIDKVEEDEVGLFAVGEVNLEVQQGKEVFALAKQGVLSDFSIGFVALSDKIGSDFRDIFEAAIIEGSIVDEPLNQDAKILEVKSVSVFQNLPLADRLHAWNSQEAMARLASVPEQKDAFIWHGNGGNKLQIADIVDGKLVVVPRALLCAAGEFKRNRSSYSTEESSAITTHLERYFAKMGIASPLADDNEFFGVDEVKSLDKRGLEQALMASGTFSRSACKIIASRYNRGEDVVDVLRSIRI